MWIRDVTITTGLVDTYSTPTLLKLVGSRQADVGRFITHRFDLDEFIDAYGVGLGGTDRRAQGRPRTILTADRGRPIRGGLRRGHRRATLDFGSVTNGGRRGDDRSSPVAPGSGWLDA